MPTRATARSDPAAAFVPSAATIRRIEFFRHKWLLRQARFRDQVGAPWWAPGLVIGSDLRGLYERELPVAEFCQDVAAIARCLLPHGSWIPRVLRTGQMHTRPRVRAGGPLSLPDLWALLPTHLSSAAIPDAECLFAFLCALADPLRFGTAANRYPAQLERLGQGRHARCGGGLCRLLDLGCGVGHGTLEAVTALLAAGVDSLRAVGCTREPLEAWMAAHRRLPHAPRAQCALECFSRDLPVHFIAGGIGHVPVRQPFDIILCNGLIGGPFLDDPLEYPAILEHLRRCLSPHGSLLVANRFHPGRRRAVLAFRGLARQAGWAVAGPWQDLTLSFRPAP